MTTAFSKELKESTSWRKMPTKWSKVCRFSFTYVSLYRTKRFGHGAIITYLDTSLVE
jgi:hypothetical protein